MFYSKIHIYAEMQVPEGMLPYLYLKGTSVHQQEHMLGIQYEPASAQDAELLKQILTNLNNNNLYLFGII